MIKHAWTVPCRFALLDAYTNNVSLIEVVEWLSVPPPVNGPADIPVVIEVVSCWQREDDTQPVEGFGRISLISPSGQTERERGLTLDLKEFASMRAVTKLVGPLLPQEGRYAVRTEMRLTEDQDWVTVAEAPLRVAFLPDGDEKTPDPS